LYISIYCKYLFIVNIYWLYISIDCIYLFIVYIYLLYISIYCIYLFIVYIYWLYISSLQYLLDIVASWHMRWGRNSRKSAQQSFYIVNWAASWFLRMSEGFWIMTWNKQASVLQCVAVRCSALQRVAVRCSALQYVAARCCALQNVAVSAGCRLVTCNKKASALQCVAVCCSAMQCVAARCSVLQRVAVRCSVYRMSGSGVQQESEHRQSDRLRGTFRSAHMSRTPYESTECHKL